MEQAFPGNLALFALLNASAQAPGWAVGLAVFLANGLIWVLLAGLIALWVAGPAAMRRALMAAGLALVIGMTLALGVASMNAAPRPFMAGIGHTLVAHAADSSFPSDHATLFWSLGLGLLLATPMRALGWAITLAGGAVAWARVYLGVHFPLDMAGSALIALIAALAARAILRRVGPGPLDAIETLYRRVLPVSR
ncbi:MAG: phosphatase PAP2 family protein [Limimaricola sp.]|uniref:undecaprenyl-diphosphatase n=1 Tax=Limimaricola sp. TaxID=2211665 RepID=UPI001DAD25A4|nr:undecaprenyl-diphosphatase [Limimaricola sp.]MBI1417845.1 phosphatase PAP2 family protein [Limimaricola sp.]